MFGPAVFMETFQPTTSSAQNIKISISTVSSDQEGNVIGSGTGTYKTVNGETQIGIRFKINPATLSFEMWETNPNGNTEFIVDGSHVGQITEDLNLIKAVWTTSNTGKKGDLLLRAE